MKNVLESKFDNSVGSLVYSTITCFAVDIKRKGMLNKLQVRTVRCAAKGGSESWRRNNLHNAPDRPHPAQEFRATPNTQLVPLQE